MHFELAKGGGTLATVDGQIADERKVLPVQAGPHQGKHQRRGTHEGHHLEAAQLSCPGKHHAGVGHAWQAGFGQQAHVLSSFNRVEIMRRVAFGRVFVEHIERGVVDGMRVAGLLQEASCRPQLFDHKGVARRQERRVGGRQSQRHRVVADGDWEQNEFSVHVGSFFVLQRYVFFRLRLCLSRVACGSSVGRRGGCDAWGLGGEKRKRDAAGIPWGSAREADQ